MLTLDPPPALGLPDKFPAWRPLQIRAVQHGVESNKRFVAQSLATGSGKSLSNVMQGMLAGRTVYLTATRALQGQLLDDFAECGMTDIRGRANYTCAYGRSGNVTCEDGSHLGCRAHKEGACDYVNALNLAKGMPLVDANYAYWMSVNKYGEGIGDVDMLVCDEADSAVDAICNMMTVELTNRELHSLKLPVPKADTDMHAWRQWALNASGVVESRLEQESAMLKREPGNADALRSLRLTKTLKQKVDTLFMSVGEWIADVTHDYTSDGGRTHTGYRFDPVWPAEYAEELLFCGVPRVLLTSATLSRKTCKLLGIADADLAYYDYPGVFDPRRSPVTWIKTGARVGENMSESEVRGWIARQDQIMRTRPRYKGIIHCNSYVRQKDIYRMSSERARFIWHNSWNTQAKIEEFKALPEDSGAVLLSPAVTTGYNFPDAQCRFQIVAKLPLVHRSSKLMKARLEHDSDWADNLEAQTFQQLIGRPVRSTPDWCQHFVCDDHWAWWYPKMLRKNLLKAWFIKQVTQASEGIPGVLKYG